MKRLLPRSSSSLPPADSPLPSTRTKGSKRSAARRSSPTTTRPTAHWGAALTCKAVPDPAAAGESRSITVSLDGLTLHLVDAATGYDKVFPIGPGAIEHDADRRASYGESLSLRAAHRDGQQRLRDHAVVDPAVQDLVDRSRDRREVAGVRRPAVHEVVRQLRDPRPDRQLPRAERRQPAPRLRLARLRPHGGRRRPRGLRAHQGASPRCRCTCSASPSASRDGQPRRRAAEVGRRRVRAPTPTATSPAASARRNAYGEPRLLQRALHVDLRRPRRHARRPSASPIPSDATKGMCVAQDDQRRTRIAGPTITSSPSRTNRFKQSVKATVCVPGSPGWVGDRCLAASDCKNGTSCRDGICTRDLRAVLPRRAGLGRRPSAPPTPASATSCLRACTPASNASECPADSDCVQRQRVSDSRTVKYVCVPRG